MCVYEMYNYIYLCVSNKECVCERQRVNERERQNPLHSH